MNQALLIAYAIYGIIIVSLYVLNVGYGIYLETLEKPQSTSTFQSLLQPSETHSQDEYSILNYNSWNLYQLLKNITQHQSITLLLLMFFMPKEMLLNLIRCSPVEIAAIVKNYTYVMLLSDIIKYILISRVLFHFRIATIYASLTQWNAFRTVLFLVFRPIFQILL